MHVLVAIKTRLIIHALTGVPGNVHDGAVWNGSEFMEDLFHGYHALPWIDYEYRDRVLSRPCLIVADKGYTRSGWLMTPFHNPQTRLFAHRRVTGYEHTAGRSKNLNATARAFNKALSADRVVAKHVTGHMTKKWGVFRNPHYSVEQTTKIQNAMILLYYFYTRRQPPANRTVNNRLSEEIFLRGSSHQARSN